MIGVELAERICSELGGKMVGNRGHCRCPAHSDKSPSLSVSIGDSGLVLVHCHAGCSQDDVIDSLRAQGLWPQNVRRRRRARRSAPLPRPRREYSLIEALNVAYGYEPGGRFSDKTLVEIERLRSELRDAGGC